MKKFLAIILSAFMLTAICGFAIGCTTTKNNDKDNTAEWDDENWTSNY